MRILHHVSPVRLRPAPQESLSSCCDSSVGRAIGLVCGDISREGPITTYFLLMCRRFESCSQLQGLSTRSKRDLLPIAVVAIGPNGPFQSLWLPHCINKVKAGILQRTTLRQTCDLSLPANYLLNLKRYEQQDFDKCSFALPSSVPRHQP